MEGPEGQAEGLSLLPGPGEPFRFRSQPALIVLTR